MVALSWLAPGASAYWSNSGEVSASANLATLSAPTISSATPGAEAVELTWSAVTAPGTGTVEYYVTRDGGVPSGGCPSSSSHSTATSCTDTGVAIGTHGYTVTTVWRTWTATSTATSATVAFGPATQLQLEASSATPLAGEADNLTVTAKDASNNTVGTYSGSHSLIFEGAAEAPDGTKPIVTDKAGIEKKLTEATEITFTEGKATVSAGKNGVMKLYKAEEAHIKVKEGALNNGAGLTVTVTAATTKKFSVPTPVEQTAGSAFNVTLTATDEWGNKTVGYAGSKTLAWSGPSNSPSGQAPSYPGTATTVTFTAGVGTAAAIILYDAQSTTLTAKEGAIAGTTPAAFTVKAAGASIFSVPTPTEREAGVAFNVTVTAWDTWHNTANSYAGSKTLAWSGPSNSPSGQAPSYPGTATTVTFTAGVGTAAAIILYDAQSTTLTAKEGAIAGTTPAAFTVKAAGASIFSVPTPTEREAGVAFNVTVTAWDTWHNTANSYAGSKTLAWSGPSNSPSGQAPSYPGTATTVTFTAGVGTATAIILYDAQSTTLTAKEGTIAGTTPAAFKVKASAATRLGFTTSPSTPTKRNIAFTTQPTVTVQDAWQNTATTNVSRVTLTPSGPTLTCTANPKKAVAGVAAFAGCKMSTAGSYTLTASDGVLTSAVSASFTIE